MSPKPYSKGEAEPMDLKPMSDELTETEGLGAETPSPRTPATIESLSPPPYQFPLEPTMLMPIMTEDGIPYDYTLPQFIRHISGEPSLEEIRNITLRVLTTSASLQQMTFHTPNLQELNLEGSGLSSLRDIGTQLQNLQILRVERCGLLHLDGTLGLRSLRELYAAGNYITSAAPCAHLSRLRILDLSRNKLQDMKSLSFLTACKHFVHLHLEGNPVSTHPEIQEYVKSVIPSLQYLDNKTVRSDCSGIPVLTPSSPIALEREDSYNTESNSSNSSSRVSSASGKNEVEAINFNKDETADDPQPGPSGEVNVSKLTSGEILCGNITTHSRRKSQSSEPPQDQDAVTSKIELEASRRWREAYYKFREENASLWRQEYEEDRRVRTSSNVNQEKICKDNEVDNKR